MATRRGQGEGSVYQETATGRWVAALSVGFGPDGRRKRLKRRARTRTDAQRLLREMRQRHDSNLPHNRINMTVDDLCTFFVTTVVNPKTGSPNTVDNYLWAIDGHIRPCLGRQRIGALTPEQVESFLRSRRDSNGLARTSLGRLRSILASMLSEAERRDWLHRNVARLAYVPEARRSNRGPLTLQEADALLEQARGHPLEAAIYLSLTRGFRPGEVLGFCWTDLNLSEERPTLTVRRSLKRERGRLSLGEPKTQSSYRVVVIPDPVLALLTKTREIQAGHRMAAGSAWTDLDLMFSTELGTLIDPSNYRRSFKKLTIAAGLGPRPPYELRHSSISLLSAAGVSIESLADMAGHSNPRTLVERYRHTMGAVVDAGAGLAAELFPGDSSE